MAAPTVTARVAPDGFKLEDGYQALIAFASDPNAVFFEMDVGVPGLDGGDPIDTTTQQNTTYRTFSPRSLVTLTPFTVRVAYDPCVYDDLITTLLNLEDAITIHWPDDSSLAFWGYLQRVEFDPMVEGEMPTATLTIVPTNWDPNNCVEAGPVVTCAGTC